jgi:hypothetical protein
MGTVVVLFLQGLVLTGCSDATDTSTPKESGNQTSGSDNGNSTTGSQSSDTDSTKTWTDEQMAFVQYDVHHHRDNPNQPLQIQISVYQSEQMNDFKKGVDIDVELTASETTLDHKIKEDVGSIFFVQEIAFQDRNDLPETLEIKIKVNARDNKSDTATFTVPTARDN